MGEGKSKHFTMSVPRSMQRMVTVPRGRGMFAMMKSRNGVISGMLLVSVYAIDFFRLSKISRPVTPHNPTNANQTDRIIDLHRLQCHQSRGSSGGRIIHDKVEFQTGDAVSLFNSNKWDTSIEPRITNAACNDCHHSCDSHKSKANSHIPQHQ